MPPTACPAPVELNAFHRGDLPPDAIDRVAAHLEGCAACEAALAALDGNADTVAAAFRGLPGAATGGWPNRPAGAFSAEVAGTVLAGRYRLAELVGEGGMGAVWAAEQTAPVKRPVAVKLIKPGMDSAAVLARFEAERQALAMMDHPNIAKVFDAGATPSGRPFFVMELVPGVPLTEFCDRRKLTPRQRLELFVPVCQAVQHAHMKGVIHRDLKPSNVLVAEYDGRPVPKVIDFGVAKAAVPLLDDRSVVTGYGAVVGTPEYMAPEQAGLDPSDVDTRADVYALGVILYELLTGTTPLTHQRANRTTLLEVLRLIREEDPPRPSSRLSTADGLPGLAAARGTDPRRLTALLRGELDWVVMKALEKDRDRRYDTANGLARDVMRYLADEPVEAGRPTAAYRLRRFARRHRPAVLAAAVALTALVVGLVALTVGLVEARRQRDIAVAASEREAVQRADAEAARRVAELAEAEALAAYRASTDDAVEQLIGSKPALGPQERAYLESALARWQRFAARTGDDERSRAARGEGLYRVAALRDTLGVRDQARAGYAAALDLQRGLVAAAPDNPAYREDLARIHNQLGVLLHDLGEEAEARTEFEAARDLRLALVAEFPKVPGYRQHLARTLNNLGNALAARRKGAEARAEYEAARALQRGLTDAHPDVLAYRQDLARTHVCLSVLHYNMGELPESRADGEEARRLQLALVASHPAVPAYREDLALTHNHLGSLYKAMRKMGEARSEYTAARDLQRGLADAFPAVPTYRVSLGGSYCNLGHLNSRGKELSAAVADYDLAIRTLTPVHEADPRDTTARQFLRNSFWGRADCHDRSARYADAARDWGRAIALSPPPEHPVLRAARAASRVRAGEVAEAVAEIADLTGKDGWTAAQWYAFARVYGFAANASRDDRGYADRAVALVTRAVRAGHPTAGMSSDPAFTSIRNRPDFREAVRPRETLPAPRAGG